ncbi:MAG: enoyl-CoA hydratase/isomerase family protein [Desulfobacterales bacterium]|jgi:enoyl-CoA hydratase/carnithine racemase|nr:enoyl-CoA hydratase/isomerase family protein [Desulfobacterales bacterium]
MSELILREEKDGLCTLMLNRPNKLNALNVELFIELMTNIEDIEKRIDTIGCVVLKGNGRCFSAGHDLKDLGAGEKPPSELFQSKTVARLATLPQPVITAVHSHCYTGALELALAGDIILAAESARFADTHGKWALTPVWGMSQRLPRRVGSAKAREMMFTAKTYTAKEALSMGLVNICVPDDRFELEIEALVASILANSWFSNRANKKLLKATDGMALSEGLRYEVEHNEGHGPDAHERMSAFGKKT